MSNSNNIKVSVIIGAYNSARALSQNLQVLSSFLKQQPYTSEIVIVDDGSDDNGATKTIAQSNNCIYIRLSTNKGKGAALRTGMLAANGQYRFFTDADIPYQPNAINDFLKALENNECAMAVGDRSLSTDNYYNQIPLSRSLASKFFALLVGKIVIGKQYDTQCGIKGFSAKAAIDLFTASKINGFAFDVELFKIALKRNYRIKKFPVALRSQDGESVSLVSSAIGMCFDLVKIAFTKY